MKNKEDTKAANPRLGAVGGQAVMEGVMMRSKTTVSIAVRQPDTKEIVHQSKPTKSIKDRIKFFKLPFIRGMVGFIEMMILSFSTLTQSTEMLGILDEEPSKFEKWLKKHLGASLMGVLTFFAGLIGIALAIFLFFFLPVSGAKLADTIFGDIGGYKNIVEGVIKIVIFILYLLLTSLIPDIKRVFMYHGAEHKSIFCYESGEELTVQNVRTKSRFHPRCGTSFMFVMIVLSIGISSLLPAWTFDLPVVRTLIKILLMPVIIGLGFEFIMYAGKHQNMFTRIMLAPGLWMQRITTKEPTDDMLEVAIVSIKAALPDEYPDFEVPAYNKDQAANTADIQEEQEQAAANFAYNNADTNEDI